MAILISGIGRSGTTTLYEIIGKALLTQHNGGRCVYEPYLWNIPEIESTADTYGQPFSVGQLGLFNMSVHCNTPLFLSERNMLHDGWLKRVFGPISSASKIAPEDGMAKVIRGAGRLEAALTLFDNLKVVVVTRNIVDTINSGLGLFSFYGDEFHPSDKSRFIKEVEATFKVNLDISKIKSEIDWSILWWHYMTEASIRTYQKFSDRVLLVPYEKYLKDMKGIMMQIYDFCGIERSYLDEKLFGNDAGPRTSVSYLDNNAINQMNSELEWYFSRLKGAGVYSQDYNHFRSSLVRKYANRKYLKSLLLTDATDLTSVTWRAMLRNSREKENGGGSTDSGYKIVSVAQAACEFGDNGMALAKMCKKRQVESTYASEKPTLGVLITNYNNKNTIEEAVFSALLQSKKPDLIMIADDCSTDGSLALLKKLASKYTNIRLVLRSANVGVAANRDLAIHEMDVDYITTLDGDDLFLPGKLELEYQAMNGSADKVAFSNIAMMDQNGCSVLDTSSYGGKEKQVMLEMLTSRSAPVPRDMMFSKALFEAAEGFDVALHMYEDWALKMRLMIASAEGGWVWSGGIGTVYNRRSPGLSCKSPIFHAHAQMIAIARNAGQLQTYPEALLAGLRTAASHLGRENKERLNKTIDGFQQNGRFDVLVKRLEAVWGSAYFGEDIDRRRADIVKVILG